MNTFGCTVYDIYSNCCTDLLKSCLWIVEMRTLNNLRELSVQTNTEVQHPTVDLHLGCCGVTSQPRVVDNNHTLPEKNV